MKQYDHIRKNLKDFNVPIDKDKLWANTAHAIPKKRRKRGAFLMLLGGALLISSAVTFYALSHSEKTLTTYTENQSTNNQTAVTRSNQTSTETIIAPNGTITGNTQNITAEKESSPEIVSREKSTVDQSNRQASAAKVNSPASQGIMAKSLLTTQSTVADDIHGKSANPSGQSFAIENERTRPLNDSEVNLNEISSPDASIENTIDAVNLESAPEVRFANFLTAEIPSLPSSEFDILTREISAPEVVASRTKNKNRINLLLIQSVGWSTMKIDTDNPELQPTIDAWKNKIASLENMLTSLQASMRLPKGIQLGAGLQYSKLTTQMEYQQTSSEEYTEHGITEIIIDEQGNVQNLMGDVKVHRQSIIHSTRFTSHTRLDVEGILSIPVIRNYRTETGVWVKVGYNILYDAKGTTFGPGDVPVKFSSTDNPYSLQSPFTFGAGIGTLYRLNPHWTLNARVGYERLRYSHGLYDDQISFHHSIFSLGLGAGYTF